jgi:hypothetical protein
MNRVRDWLRRQRERADEGEVGAFSLPGLISRLEWVLALVGLVLIVGFAMAGSVEGVVATIAILLAGVLLSVVAGGRE